MIKLNLYMPNVLSLKIWPPLGTVYNNVQQLWKISFQDIDSPICDGITELHSSLFSHLVIIFVGVGWMMMIGSIVLGSM
jgi:hypothetical protein